MPSVIRRFGLPLLTASLVALGGSPFPHRSAQAVFQSNPTQVTLVDVLACLTLFQNPGVNLSAEQIAAGVSSVLGQTIPPVSLNPVPSPSLCNFIEGGQAGLELADVIAILVVFQNPGVTLTADQMVAGVNSILGSTLPASSVIRIPGSQTPTPTPTFTPTSTPLVPGSFQGSLVFEEINRSYEGYLPTNVNSGGKLPLVLMFHPCTQRSNASVMPQFTSWSTKAESEGFIAIYPNTRGIPDPIGENNIWLNYSSPNREPNDVNFIQTLIEDLKQKYPIDETKIYATGVSCGSAFSSLLGYKISSQIAAIALVEGTTSLRNVTPGNPKRPLPVIHICGTSELGFGGDCNPDFYAGSDALLRYGNFWINENQCLSTPTITEPQQDIRKARWTCAENTSVEVIVVEGAGHIWPGGDNSLIGPPGFSEDTLGPDGFSATDVIWDFFKQHSLPR